MRSQPGYESCPIEPLFPELALDLGEATVSPPRLKRPTVGLPGRLGELAGAWLTEYPAATAVAYLCDLRSFVGFCTEAGIDPLKVKRVDLARFAASLSAAGRAPASVARSLSGLSSFYGYLVATGVLSVSPATGLRRPRRAGGVRLGPSSDELARLLVAARRRGRMPYCLAALLGTAGMRVSEACGLAVADRGRDAGAPVVYALRKGGVKEMVTISEHLAGALDELAGGRHPDAPLLTGPSGGWLTRQQAGRIIRELGVDAGIERPVYPHLLRHGFVSIALESGVPLSAVGEAAGHRDLAITLGYASALPARSAAPAEVVAAVVGERLRHSTSTAA